LSQYSFRQNRLYIDKISAFQHAFDPFAEWTPAFNIVNQEIAAWGKA